MNAFLVDIFVSLDVRNLYRCYVIYPSERGGGRMEGVPLTAIFDLIYSVLGYPTFFALMFWWFYDVNT